MFIYYIRDTQAKLKEPRRLTCLATTSVDETPQQVRLGPDLNVDLRPQIPHDHIESQVQTGEATWDRKGGDIVRLAEDGTLKRFREEIAIQHPDAEKIKFESDEEKGLEKYI